MTPPYLRFNAGDVTLQSGRVFPSLQIAYQTYGKLNAARDNAIVYLTSYGAHHYDLDWLVGDGAPFDTSKWFVVIANMLGNGLSSSPSNASDRVPLSDYPIVTYHDAVAAQYRLVTEALGISKIALVYGFSMGAMQAYHWAALHSDMIERVAIVCGSARVSPYNRVFLDGVRAALTADSAFQDGHFTRTPERAFRAMGRVYAGWAMSHAFYRDELWREAGFDSLDAYLAGSWDSNFARHDANDLLAQLNTWAHGDISRHPAFDGDLDTALAAVRCHIRLMPSETDRYFDAEDNRRELPKLVNARSAALHPIPSLWGHRAGNPQRIPADRIWLEAQIRALLDLPA